MAELRSNPRTGRFTAGVHIEGEKCPFVATILVAQQGDVEFETFSHREHRLTGDSREELLEEALAWAREHVPQRYGVDPDLLDVEVLKYDLIV
ncbi:MAG: hypothetical protein HY684_00175 [Chloroflexi bacterium]|nr:hypothetical protein [Chloroflexota bacterium]